MDSFNSVAISVSTFTDNQSTRDRNFFLPPPAEAAQHDKYYCWKLGKLKMETKRKRWDPIEKLNFSIQWNVNIDGNVCDSVSVCFLATAFIIQLGLWRSVYVFSWLRNICWWCIALWLPELSTTISARSGLLSTNFECYVWEQWRDSDERDRWKEIRESGWDWLWKRIKNTNESFQAFATFWSFIVIHVGIQVDSKKYE